MSGVTAGLRALLGCLVAYKVDFAHEHYDGNDHHETSLADADVISSRLNLGAALKANMPSDEYSTGWDMDVHQIVVDIDHMAYLVESTTPGHHHLYIELPTPLSSEAYFEWLDACVKIGLVEPGYVSAFKARGFTCVRLPWVQKPGVAATPASPPVPKHSPEIPVEDLGGL